MTNFTCIPIPTIPFLDPIILAPEAMFTVMQSAAAGTDQIIIPSSHNQTIPINYLKTNGKVLYPEPALGNCYYRA
jgi:hypothetical protein